MASAHGFERRAGGRCGGPHGHFALERRGLPRRQLGSAREQLSPADEGRGRGEGCERGGRHSGQEAGRRTARLHGARARRPQGEQR